MKRTFCILMLLISVLFCSCQSSGSAGLNMPFELETEYQISVSRGQYKTDCTFILKEDGSYHIKHSDPKSSLFGMEEIITADGKNLICLGEMVLEDPYEDHIGITICHLLKELQNSALQQKEAVTLEGVILDRYSWQQDENQMDLFFIKNSNKIAFIQGTYGTNQLKLTFLQVQPKSPN